MSEKIYIDGWLFRQEQATGSLSTWRKRWHVLTLRTLKIYSTPACDKELDCISVASIEEMAYGTNIGDKKLAFSLLTPRGEIKFAASTEADRSEWVEILREVVPQAKLKKQAELIIEKKDNVLRRETTQAVSVQCIENMLNDCDRVEARGGLESNINTLCEKLIDLGRSVGQVTTLDEEALKPCQMAVTSLVEAANTAAAICNNRGVQKQIVKGVRQLITQSADLVDFSTTAERDEVAREKMYRLEDKIKQEAQQLREMVKGYADFVAMMEQSLMQVETGSASPLLILQQQQQQEEVENGQQKTRVRANSSGIGSTHEAKLLDVPLKIESSEESSHNGRALPSDRVVAAKSRDSPVADSLPLEQLRAQGPGMGAESRNRSVSMPVHRHKQGGGKAGETEKDLLETMQDQGKLVQHQLDKLKNPQALESPDTVAAYARDTTRMVQQLLEGTSVLAQQQGVELSQEWPGMIDQIVIPDSCQLSEHKRQQLHALLMSAKGFAAATSNMIDLLKYVPYQQDDPVLLSRLSVSTKSADNALQAFINASSYYDASETSIRLPTPQQAVLVAEGLGAQSQAGVLLPGPAATEPLSPDLESSLLAAMKAVESSLAKLTNATQQQPIPAPTESVRSKSSSSSSSSSSLSSKSNGSNSDALLEACRRMGEATKSLMAAAAASQKESPSGSSSSSSSSFYRKDRSGVAESAQGVVRTVQKLVEEANLPIGERRPENVVAAARCVKGATARLVSQARVNGENSPAQQQLEQASLAIAKAVNYLVNMAQKEKDQPGQRADEDEEGGASGKRKNMSMDPESLKKASRVEQIRAEFEAQARIAKLESDLDSARKFLFNLRRAVYGRGEEDY